MIKLSHHIAVTLPDGREAWADYRQPIARVLRRINQRIADPSPKTGRVPGCPQDLHDKTLVATWLDTHPGEACPPYCDDDHPDFSNIAWDD